MGAFPGFVMPFTALKTSLKTFCEKQEVSLFVFAEMAILRPAEAVGGPFRVGKWAKPTGLITHGFFFKSQWFWEWNCRR